MAETAPIGEIDPADRRWVLEDLTPISRKEGLRRSPYVKGGGITILGNERTGEAYWFTSYFFECRHYDPETKECRNWENRPPICSGFPWYGAPPDNSKALPEECSFRADQTGVHMTIVDKLNSRWATLGR